jgi:hypothetical protein
MCPSQYSIKSALTLQEPSGACPPPSSPPVAAKVEVEARDAGGGGDVWLAHEHAPEQAEGSWIASQFVMHLITAGPTYAEQFRRATQYWVSV